MFDLFLLSILPKYLSDNLCCLFPIGYRYLTTKPQLLQNKNWESSHAMLFWSSTQALDASGEKRACLTHSWCLVKWASHTRCVARCALLPSNKLFQNCWHWSIQWPVDLKPSPPKRGFKEEFLTHWKMPNEKRNTWIEVNPFLGMMPILLLPTSDWPYPVYINIYKYIQHIHIRYTYHTCTNHIPISGLTYKECPS